MTTLVIDRKNISALIPLIQSVEAGMPDAIIDIHIERGEIDIKSRPSGYAMTARSAQEAFEAFRERIERLGVRAFDYAMPQDMPLCGCKCGLCELERERRGF